MPERIDIGILTFLTTHMPVIAALTLCGISIFVLSRNPRAAANRLFSAGTLALAGTNVAWFAFTHSPGVSSLLLWQRMIMIANVIMLPTWYLFSVTFGSAGIREGLRRQQYLAWGIGVVSLFSLCLVPTNAVIKGVLVRYDGSISFPLGWAGKALMVVSLAISMLVLSNLEMTFRHANRRTRWKIKFVILGLFAIVGFQIFWLSRALLHGTIFPVSFGAQAGIHMTAGVLMIFSLVRHRLMDVDVFVSRYVVYRSLTLLLAGTYLFLLGIGQDAVRLLGFQLGGEASAVLLMTGGLSLAALLLTDSFRRRVKIFIDTHFYKNKYDYRKEWLSLTERLAQSVTIDEVAPHIVEGLLETMWVRKAGIFLLEGDKTQLRMAFGIGFGPDDQVIHADRTLLDHLSDHPGPIDLGRIGFAPLGRLSTDLLNELRRRDVLIAAPLVVRDEVLGLLVVGPELSGQAFRPDDYDLCRTVAAQAATAIMNARMAEDLAHGREIRAFAEMSSFVIHDIKNIANTLSLVASNAEAHIHTPAFQQDAIRAIRQSVDKMQMLLKRLSGIKPGPLRRELIDLNDLTRDSLRALAGSVRETVHIQTTWGPMPSLFGDPDQLESVVRNLIMNAIEAVDGTGEITIESFRDGEEAVLVITDNGRGMSAEFMRHALFRPFRSTKGGFGIGLYQCKQVAEIHGGRIEVKSAEGQGTTCVLRLPIDGRTDMSQSTEKVILQGQTTL